jgi:nitroreductase
LSIDCLDKITSRRSIRKFTDDPIPETVVHEIIRIGITTPSAGNCQPWRIVVVTEKKLRSRLAIAAHNQNFVAAAPVVFVVCAVPEESAKRYQNRGRELYVLQDTAALTLNILYGAHLQGYGACWVGAFNEAEVTKTLNIPSEMRPVAMVPIGRIAGEIPPLRGRRDSTEIIVSESFDRN